YSVWGVHGPIKHPGRAAGVLDNRSHNAGFSVLFSDQPRSCRALCGAWLARARTLVEAETRIWDRVRPAVSEAKSASRITLSAAAVFSAATLRLRIVDPIVFFWKAPRRPRRPETCSMAEATTFWAWVRSPSTTFRALPEPTSLRKLKVPEVEVSTLPILRMATSPMPMDTLPAISTWPA